MKHYRPFKILFLFAVLVLPDSFSYGQFATTFTPTTVADSCEAWLLGLNPVPGSGRISIFKEDLGPMSLSIPARNYADSLSVFDLYNNAAVFNTGLSAAGINVGNYFDLSANMGGNFMRSPQCFAWALVEPTPGTYNYRLTDTIVRHSNQSGVDVLGTINFYADSASECNPAIVSGCPLFGNNGTMYFINNDRTGKICDSDTARYKLFVQNLIERYDGDGNSDMPGLTSPVLYWEIGNEPEGGCANGMTSTEYGEILRMSYQTIKTACPNCTVLHGGTIGPYDSTFWNEVYINYYQFFDIANIHVNAPRNASFNFSHMDDQLSWIENLENISGNDYKTWVTEWGIYYTSPNGAVITPYISEESQAARYVKFYAYGLANDIEMWLFDQSGDSTMGIGSSALLNNVGMNKQAKLSLYSLWLYDYKFATIDSAVTDLFTTDIDFSSGLIRVYKSGIEYDVVWGLNGLPPDITGIKKITDIYGLSVVQDVATLSFPLSTNPIILEPDNTSVNEQTNQSAIVAKIYPNPASHQIKFEVTNLNGAPAYLRIFDLTGKTMLNQVLTTNNHSVELSNWSSGIYFYELYSESSRIAVGKFVKD